MVPGAPMERNALSQEPMVDSSIHISQSPQLRSSLINAENIWSPSTETQAEYPLHTSYHLPCDPEYKSPSNPGVWTRGWIYS